MAHAAPVRSSLQGLLFRVTGLSRSCHLQAIDQCETASLAINLTRLVQIIPYRQARPQFQWKTPSSVTIYHHLSGSPPASHQPGQAPEPCDILPLDEDQSVQLSTDSQSRGVAALFAWVSNTRGRRTF